MILLWSNIGEDDNDDIGLHDCQYHDHCCDAADDDSRDALLSKSCCVIFVVLPKRFIAFLTDYTIPTQELAPKAFTRIFHLKDLCVFKGP